jgi:hypothetical protein
MSSLYGDLYLALIGCGRGRSARRYIWDYALCAWYGYYICIELCSTTLPWIPEAMTDEAHDVAIYYVVPHLFYKQERTVLNTWVAFYRQSP